MTQPDFVIAGAYRSGTTTLRTWLAQHPDVFMPALAEPSYFAFDSGRYPEFMLQGANDPFARRRTTRLEEYLRLFEHSQGAAVVGECSPEYLRAPGSASRLAAHNPECRVVITLRSPADRLISDWMMCRRDGVEALDLAEAVVAIQDRRASGSFGGHYEATSRYAEGLSEFLDAFPPEQLLVLIHEQWINTPQNSAEIIGTFLGIDPNGFAPEFPQSNSGGTPTGRLSAALWNARRRAAPILGARVPDALQRPIDRWLAGTLDKSVSAKDRSIVRSILADENDAVRNLLGKRLREWE